MIAQPFWKKLAAVRLNRVSFGSVLNETTKRGLHRCGEAYEGRKMIYLLGSVVMDVVILVPLLARPTASVAQEGSVPVSALTSKRQSARMKTTTRVCKRFETETDRDQNDGPCGALAASVTVAHLTGTPCLPHAEVDHAT